MQTNAALRKRAFRLYGENRKTLWPAFLLIALTNLIWFMIQTYLLQTDLMRNTLSIVYQLVLAPITLGLNLMMLRLVKGSEARLSMLFDFFQRPQTLRKVYAACLFIQLPSLLITLFLSVIDAEGVQPSQALLLLGGTLAAGFFITWLSLRLFLFPYLFVLSPEEKITALVKASFQIMKGRGRRLIWFYITVYFWLFLFFVGYALVSPPIHVFEAVNAALPQRMLVQLSISLVSILLNPYFYLAMAGFANEQMKIRTES